MWGMLGMQSHWAWNAMPSASGNFLDAPLDHRLSCSLEFAAIWIYWEVGIQPLAWWRVSLFLQNVCLLPPHCVFLSFLLGPSSSSALLTLYPPRSAGWLMAVYWAFFLPWCQTMHYAFRECCHHGCHFVNDLNFLLRGLDHRRCGFDSPAPSNVRLDWLPNEIALVVGGRAPNFVVPVWILAPSRRWSILYLQWSEALRVVIDLLWVLNHPGVGHKFLTMWNHCHRFYFHRN